VSELLQRYLPKLNLPQDVLAKMANNENRTHGRYHYCWYIL